MTVWISVGVVALVAGYLLGRFLQPRSVLQTVKIYLDDKLQYQRTDPEVADLVLGEPVIWEVLIDSADPPDVDVDIDFQNNASPFKEKKVKSGKGNAIFGRFSKNKGEFHYSVAIEDRNVADPVIIIREKR